MGIVPQYGLPVYHIAQLLSMNIFHNSGACASFFCAYFAENPPYTAAVILWNPVRAAPRKLPPVLTFADVPPIMFFVQSMKKEGHTP